MDQIKVGRFIAECRKEKKLTQAQLAEKLCITDKAISKWERGITMPDSSIMLDLCEILGISVNELLRGEKINVEDDHNKTEELLLEMTKKEEAARKKLHTYAKALTVILVFLGVTVGSLWGCLLGIEGIFIFGTIVAIVAMILLFVAIFLINRMELDAGPFECKSCHHTFIPTIKEAFWTAPPVGVKKYSVLLKCPECGKKTWAKKVLPK